MYQKPLLNLLTSLATLALVFSQVGIVQAAKIDFGGEPGDNFWVIDTTYCKDGFSITATHTHLGVDGKAFWLELGSSSIPATGLAEVNLPPTPPFPLARIVHGDGSSLINAGQPFTVNFFFTTAQQAGTPITVTIERWDHGNMTAHEVNEDGSDESPNDDIKVDTQVIGNCLIDSTVESVSTILNPKGIHLGENSHATVSLNNIPVDGYTSTEITCHYNASLAEVSNIATTELFGPDAATITTNPQNGSFIVAMAGSNGRKATTGGAAFTFDVKGIQAGQTELDCTARISKGDGILTSLPSSADALTILDNTPTITGLLQGQVLALKPVTINLYRADTSLAASTPANPDGTFSLSAPVGSYTAVATSSGFLDAQGSITISDGNTATLSAITLLPGDIDDNNVIDQFDALTIGMNYNMNIPAAADLNNDGTINVLDLELLANNYRKTGPLPWQSDGTEPSGPSFATDVMPIFENHCTACHGSNSPAGSWDASSYDSIMEIGNPNPVIIPGDTTNSVLVQRISGASGSIMPPSGMLSASEIQIIKDWINAGALNN
jgi:cytochrome c